MRSNERCREVFVFRRISLRAAILLFWLQVQCIFMRSLVDSNVIPREPSRSATFPGTVVDCPLVQVDWRTLEFVRHVSVEHPTLRRRSWDRWGCGNWSNWRIAFRFDSLLVLTIKLRQNSVTHSAGNMRHVLLWISQDYRYKDVLWAGQYDNFLWMSECLNSQIDYLNTRYGILEIEITCDKSFWLSCNKINVNMILMES